MENSKTVHNNMENSSNIKIPKNMENKYITISNERGEQ